VNQQEIDVMAAVPLGAKKLYAAAFVLRIQRNDVGADFGVLFFFRILVCLLVEWGRSIRRNLGCFDILCNW